MDERPWDTTLGLFSLDVLPGHSTLETQVKFGRDWSIRAVRFRALRPRRWRRQEHSEWSGWFDYEGEPIALSWASFWD